GNRRLTAQMKIAGEPEFQDEEKWKKIKCRILPPEVTREMVDELLGELHVAKKNPWTSFEQAAHLFRLSEKGHGQKNLAHQYRMSPNYVGAKLKAYGLMSVYLKKAREQGKEIKDPTSKWSWFEEFYKKCMTQPKKKETDRADRVYDGA